MILQGAMELIGDSQVSFSQIREFISERMIDGSSVG